MTQTTRDPEPSATPAPPERLFVAGRIASVTVLAGGTALYAMNLYFTAALLPSIVGEIGGAELYAWVATGFLVAAVVASMLVARVSERLGARGSYLLACSLFAAGSAAAALSPVMGVFIASRVLQGLGGGLLAGLGYAVIRSVLPAGVWLKAAGLISAMWGVGALIGPSLGGVFAELGAWRAAYAVLALAALLLGVVSAVSLPAGQRGGSGPLRLPLLSLAALVAAAAGFSIAPLAGRAGIVSLCGGVVALVLFLCIERNARNTVLPRAVFVPGNPLKWVYLLVAALCGGVMIETYVPLFGQELGGLTPVWAGLLGAALSIGWTTAQLVSVKFGPRTVAGAMVCAPIVLSLSMLAYGALQEPGASGARIALWVAALVLGGVAIGSAFPHLSVAALGSSEDELEGQQAAAALSTTQLISYALVSALLGVFAAAGDGPGAAPAEMAERIALGLAALTGAGAIAGAMLLKTSRR